MMDEATPLDADDLMNFAERIEQLPASDAEWVGSLFQECMRARMREAELLSGQVDAGEARHAEAGQHNSEFETQLAQVALDTAEWLKTLWNVGYMGAGSFPSQPRSAFPLVELEDVLKSALFGRIREGKKPLPFPPPTRHGLPWHDLLESRETTHMVEAEIVRDEQGQALCASIEACSDWNIVEEVFKDREYLVQHRGKGPIFRLNFDQQPSLLSCEPPRWTRQIRTQERGGFRSYTLEWLKEDGSVLPVSLRATTWERAETEAAQWIAMKHPEMYGQVSFKRLESQ